MSSVNLEPQDLPDPAHSNHGVTRAGVVLNTGLVISSIVVACGVAFDVPVLTWVGVAAGALLEARRNFLPLVGGPAAAVDPIASADYPTPAARPANSELDCGKLERTFGLRLPAWQEGVAECVERLVRG